eukprot:CAMPEP_0175323062 /NCGR_PEP_ID=MMETSP0093-20121207/72790_1 /TAXON_ID=311494 /ORGANISM="Alexandrium monilatum, Strain CCMP3105" /LENGTH=555 /DNA_ID=CAMNT_0016619957 /DNA_START=49 /DNA_END=1712 /DNA_ORIENTATION=+
MSDVDMPEVHNDMGDEMSDDGMGGDYNPPPELPEGVTKEITKAGEGWKKPKAGDEVTVHYVGTLAADGSEFDSSRGRGEPFVFTLGQGSVIKGWDVGVATMKKGELAKFTLAPEFAYGESGSPPKIPANASLVFEIELLSWLSKDDLFQDGGVIKTLLKDGTGWTKPNDGDEVRISVKCTAKDGSVVDERSGLDYTIGSGALGQLGKAVDKALTGMKKEEEAELACTKDYACGDKTPEGATLKLTLEHTYETTDVSLAKDKSMMKKQIVDGEAYDKSMMKKQIVDGEAYDKSMMKKQIVDGEAYDKPKDTAKATLRVEAATSGAGEPLEGFAAQTLEFTVGNGEVCDALECAVCEMKKGEKALLTCTKPQLCVDERIARKEAGSTLFRATLELQSFEKAKDTWSMSEAEKLEYAAARKEAGSTLFRAGRVALAMGQAKDTWSMSEAEKLEYAAARKEAGSTLFRAGRVALAMGQAKDTDHAEAKKTCDKILSEDSSNVKARFRRAQADFGMKNFLDCLADLKRIIEVDPQNREARTLLKEAQAGQKEEDKKSKGL